MDQVSPAAGLAAYLLIGVVLWLLVTGLTDVRERARNELPNPEMAISFFMVVTVTGWPVWMLGVVLWHLRVRVRHLRKRTRHLRERFGL